MLEIVYRPQALFRVRAVTRCTSSIPGNGIMVAIVIVVMVTLWLYSIGHTEAVISVQFSPDGRYESKKVDFLYFGKLFNLDIWQAVLVTQL